MAMTVAEAMAMAVIRGDRIAAYALADKLIEERNNPENLQQQAAKLRADRTPTAFDGYEVFSWPEFQAFARRIGLLVDLRTREVSFTLKEGELIVINHSYVGYDAGPQGEASEQETQG